MALTYDLVRFSKSGLTAQQSAQRDWSPYLVHFTRYAAMKTVRKVIKRTASFSAKDVGTALEDADRTSWNSVKQILATSTPFLQKHSPQEKEGLPECVCLSQCTLPGLFGHSERFGRFGFVFDKLDIYDLGGRPCAYLDADSYGWLDAKHGSDTDQTPSGAPRMSIVQQAEAKFRTSPPNANGAYSTISRSRIIFAP